MAAPGRSAMRSASGRKSGGGGGGSTSTRNMFEAYVKKLRESFFNDLTVELQQGDVFIGSTSITQSPKVIGGQQVQPRKVLTWGIVPTLVGLRGVGDFKGTYILKDARNTLDRSGGLQTKLNLVTTDEMIQKGTRMTNIITSVLGPNFAQNYLTSFIYEAPINVLNIDISRNIMNKKTPRKGYYSGTRSGGTGVVKWVSKKFGFGGVEPASEVMSENAKVPKDVEMLDFKVREVFGYRSNVGEGFYQRGGDNMRVAHNAMSENMRITALNNYADWEKEYKTEQSQIEQTEAQGGSMDEKPKVENKKGFLGLW